MLGPFDEEAFAQWRFATGYFAEFPAQKSATPDLSARAMSSGLEHQKRVVTPADRLVKPLCEKPSAPVTPPQPFKPKLAPILGIGPDPQADYGTAPPAASRFLRVCRGCVAGTVLRNAGLLPK